MNALLNNLQLITVIVAAAQEIQVPPALVVAIIEAESGGNPYAMCINPHYPHLALQSRRPAATTLDTETLGQKTAWGLMQLMGANARVMGHDGWLGELLTPELNVKYGIQFLGGLMSKYYKAHGLDGVIAAYNMGTPRKRPDGKFVNQFYVDRVKAASAKYEPLVQAACERAVEEATKETKEVDKEQEPAERALTELDSEAEKAGKNKTSKKP